MPVRPIMLILGPTAGGKTALSVALAKSLPGGGECISADSMQVYRGMDVGTAKPTEAERGGVPHHLLDIADPADVARAYLEFHFVGGVLSRQVSRLPARIR